MKNLLGNEDAFDLGLDVGKWAALFIGIMVLFLVVAALFPSLTDALTDYNATEPVFGAVLIVIVPILIGAGLLLLVVRQFIGKGL